MTTFSGLVSLPHQKFTQLPVYIADDKKIKKQTGEHTSSDMLFIPTFVKIHQLVQMLLGVKTCMCVHTHTTHT